MAKFLKRWLAYFLIPMGLILAFIPLNSRRNMTETRDYMFLQITGPAGDESAGESGDAAGIDVSVVKPADLAGFPAMHEQLNNMVRLLSFSRKPALHPTRLEEAAMGEWNGFAATFLIDSDEPVFQYQSHVFQGRLRPSYNVDQVEVKNLKIGYKVAGGVFLLISLFALAGMYTAPVAEGIRVGKRGAIIVWDVVIIIVGIPFTWWFLDVILVKFFQTEPFWKDQMVLGMGVFWMVFVNPVMALITTATSVQTLDITKENITLKGLFGQRVMAWQDVEKLEIADVLSPRSSSGIVPSRKAVRILNISGGTASLRIMEPPLVATKKEIIEALSACAPENLQDSVAGLSQKWLSIW